ncbi:DUF72 domain-containing protein [Microbacterium murale]|uniref:DUF72 domain-containing protein n=1 Tax=Microbacterium murale TaxID=1081040 RepID=A0ABQ1RCV4_9MICO|nr:hypothetical protein GCM10007269_06570 [Microbacterium murale]
MASGVVRVGTSGWRYASWRSDFYPVGLPQRRELEYIGEHFSTLELNGSFYSLQRPASYHRWRDSVPEGFVFAGKGSRYVTHMLRLRHVETALANFFASGVLALGPALGPVLWQLPERQEFQPELLERSSHCFRVRPARRSPWRNVTMRASRGRRGWRSTRNGPSVTHWSREPRASGMRTICCVSTAWRWSSPTPQVGFRASTR